MISNNKILTVSYGTFSCTLEGFDDSFGTMKAIAEYFRDLASDDRYFGAEPPQPDVEMLARIAEREISRRVDAREHDGRFVLSAEQAKTAEETALPDAAPAEATSEPAPSDVIAAPEAEVVSDSIAETEQLDTPEIEVVAEAEVIDVIDVAEEPADVAEVLEPETVTPEASEQEALSPEAPEAPAAIEVEEVEVAEVDDAVAADAEDMPPNAEEFFSQPEPVATPEATEDLTEAEIVEATEAAAPDSIAAKLQRIRAVVSKSQEDADDIDAFEDEYSEDLEPGSQAAATIVDIVETVTIETVTTETVIENVAQDIEALQEFEDDILNEDEDGEDNDSDDMAAILARFDAEAEAEVEVEVEADVADEHIEDPAESAGSEDSSDTLLLDTLAAFVASDLEEDDPTGENLFDDGAMAEQDEMESIEVEDETDAADTNAPRARIIKVKRSEIDAAIASGTLEEVDDAENEDEASSLSDEQEAGLLADLAEVEAESPRAETTAAEFDDAEGTDDNEDVIAKTAVEDDDVSRLMAEADNQMDEPESTKRRSAFAHLKAAVMAKKADIGIGKEDEDKDGAYRSDLASVVKPRRPEARGTSERPEGPRPAPLKLVAEQRVDIGAAAPAGPVRPRRVAARDEAQSADTGTSFEDYATEMGANDLPELLEAAASYLSFVEGREQFSRPQLMTKVRQVEKDDFSREDGLRSFGQLLRAGKIEKIKGGRFAVTGDIGYRPDHRAAG